jgi:metal-responsive CopG/Arc/MetJ family transcriptional regulator
MPKIKTAISIEKSVFEKMDMLAKKIKISRSRLFSMAARVFIHRNKNAEIFYLINEVYNDLPESEPIVSAMCSTHYKIVKDQW